MYENIVIDFNYYFTRNFFKLKYSFEIEGIPFDRNRLYKSVFCTIFNAVNLHNPKNVFLVADKRPYLRSKYIDTYKKDRVTKLASLKKEFGNNPTEENKKKIDWEVICENERSKKGDLLPIFDKLGFICLCMGGYEADDFSYYLSKYFLENKQKSILISKDSDWEYFVNDYTDLQKYNDTKIYSKKKLYTGDKLKSISDAGSLILYGVLHKIYFGSHDNVYGIKSKIKKEYSFSDFINLYKEDNQLEALSPLLKEDGIERARQLLIGLNPDSIYDSTLNDVIVDKIKNKNPIPISEMEFLNVTGFRDLIPHDTMRRYIDNQS